MNGDVSVVFIQRITQFYLYSENISFSKYFHQHFLGDKLSKFGRDSRNEKPSKVRKAKFRFLKMRFTLKVQMYPPFTTQLKHSPKFFLYTTMLLNAGGSA